MQFKKRNVFDGISGINSSTVLQLVFQLVLQCDLLIVWSAYYVIYSLCDLVLSLALMEGWNSLSVSVRFIVRFHHSWNITSVITVNESLRPNIILQNDDH